MLKILNFGSDLPKRNMFLFASLVSDALLAS